jgi:hypothetical protein
MKGIKEKKPSLFSSDYLHYEKGNNTEWTMASEITQFSMGLVSISFQLSAQKVKKKMRS